MSNTKKPSSSSNVNSTKFSPQIPGVTQYFQFYVKLKHVLQLYLRGVRFPSISGKSMTFKDFVVGTNDVIFDIEVTISNDVLSIRLIRRSQRLSNINISMCYATITGIERVFEPMKLTYFHPAKLVAGSDKSEFSTITMKSNWNLKRISGNTYDFQPMTVLEKSQISITGSIFYRTSASTLQTDANSLLNDIETSDVKIIIGEKTFHAHKLFLRMRSSFFKGLFDSNMKESLENVISLPEDNPEVFEQVLHYIYTDNCPEISTMAVNLLVPADKYDLQGLRFICEEEMMKTMNKDNVCHYLMRSGMTNSVRIYDKCADFIVKNRKKVTETKGWSVLKESKECGRFLADIFEKMDK